MLSKFFQHHPQVLLLFLFGLGEDEYVVDEDDDKLVQVFHEDFVHEVHEVGWGIG